MHGFLGAKYIKERYAAYDNESYELGTALARITQPSDLVVTVAKWIGDPVAIYYSQRRGWIFPPAWPGNNWWEDIVDEAAAIRSFDELRLKGAKWFGIVASQKTKFRQANPRLLAHIESTTKLIEESGDWAIYRIPPSK